MKIWVMVPTYNESENIENLLVKLLKIKNINVVVVDDNSPDGTGAKVREIARKNKRVKLLNRKTNKGRGYAGRDGFLYCLQKKADIIVEMDADFSHNPKYIPSMIKELKNADMVLGSRMVKGGSDTDRNIIRQYVTKGANLFIRILIGISVKDCNSGFRVYKRKVLQGISVKSLTAGGPDIVQEVLFRVSKKGFKIKEYPIDFVDRKIGESKLKLRFLFKGYLMVVRLRLMGWKNDT